MIEEKKGEGLPIRIIIVAIIGIICMVILIFVFQDKLGEVLPIFSAQADCNSRGYNCIQKDDPCSGTKVIGMGCPEEGGDGNAKYCCVTSGE